MSKASRESNTKRGVVVRRTVITPLGSAVKATRLDLSQEGERSLQSKSSGIHSANDGKTAERSGCSSRSPAYS